MTTFDEKSDLYKAIEIESFLQRNHAPQAYVSWLRRFTIRFVEALQDEAIKSRLSVAEENQRLRLRFSQAEQTIARLSKRA